MRVPFARPLIGKEEIAAATSVLQRSRMLSNAGCVADFEEKFVECIGGGHAVAVANCTAALHMAMLALDIGPGDEVIIPALTFVACAHAVEAVGATPIFADCYPSSGVVEPAMVKQRITKSTKAIMAVHFAGRPCYMGGLLDVARHHEIPIIEDCATALGARHSGRHVGLLGDIGCFSFHPVKHITTGEGGMLTTRRPEIFERLRLLREFGKYVSAYTTARSDRSSLGNYDVKSFGLNYRMTEVQGAIGAVALGKAAARLKQRRTNYACLRHELQEHIIIDLGIDESAFYTFVVILPDGIDQNEFRLSMARRFVETTVYYPGPLPLLTYYREKYGYRAGEFPCSERISSRSVALPVGPHLGLNHMQYIVKSFKESLDENSANRGVRVYRAPPSHPPEQAST